MKYLRIVKLNFLYCVHNPKYIISVLYLVLYSYNRIHGMVAYANSLKIEVTPWLLPFLPGSSTSFIPLMLAFVLLVSDAPFCTAQQQFVVLRTGKRTWLCGQLLFLFVISVGFSLLLWILSWIWFLPVLTWSDEWGEALITAALTGTHAKFDVFLTIKYAVMKNANPLEVTAWCVIVMTAVCYLLGVIITACNLWLKKGLGAVFASVLVVISTVPSIFSQEPGLIKLLFWVSPLTWMDRSLMGQVSQNLPSYSYGIYSSVIIGMVLSVSLMATIHKYNWEIGRE